VQPLHGGKVAVVLERLGEHEAVPVHNVFAGSNLAVGGRVSAVSARAPDQLRGAFPSLRIRGRVYAHLLLLV